MEETIALRIAELQSLSWQKQKAIATGLGLDKPSDVSWDEFCETIARLEAELKNAPQTEEEELAAEMEFAPTAEEEAIVPPDSELVEPESACDLIPVPPQVLTFEFAGTDRRCPQCGETIRTNLSGQVICPIARPDCPRNGD